MPRDDETKAAFGIYPKQRSKPSSPETIKGADDLVKLLGDIVLPKDAVDVGMMALPIAGPMRKLGAALIAGGATTDAQAGGLSALMRLLSKEAPAQARQIREALGRAYTTNLEHSVVGSADKGPVGSIVSGTYDEVSPNQRDIYRALTSDRPIADFHTHPFSDQHAFDVSPSLRDFSFASNEYFPGKQNRELRTIIASPADLSSRSPSAYSFFATDNPSKIFDTKNLKDAVVELQRAGSKGTFKSVLDDSRFREYFDNVGSMGELAENIAPLSLLDLRKAQGMGRGEVMLSGRPLSKNIESTNTELFRMMNPIAVEFLTKKGFADGGPVYMAQGGPVNMGLGGLLKLKGAAKVLPHVEAKVLPRVEAEANLAKFLEPSKTPMRLYHGTTATEGGLQQEAIRRLKPSKEGALGSGVYLTPKPAYANTYADTSNLSRSDASIHEMGGQNVLPVHAQIRNPLVLNGGRGDPMIEALTKLGMDEASARNMVERAYEEKGYIGKQVESRARAAGYDGLMQYRNGELSEVVSYNPNAIKSATGNQGTYDIASPDLSKAKGGSIHMAHGGQVKTNYEDGGAAFGVFPQMRPRRALQDREASANAPLSALRGYAAGTAGLAGDIEGLTRAGLAQLSPRLLTGFPALSALAYASRVDQTPKLPTTEFYNEYLPGAQLNETPTGKAFTTAGNLFGGTGATDIARLGVKGATALSSAGVKGAMLAGRAGERLAERVIPEIMDRGGLGADLLQSLAQGSRSSVIKAPGGNWLSGSVEDSVNELKRHQNPEEALQLYASSAANPATTPETLAQLNQRLPQWQRETALNNFIDKQLTRYVKNDMATPGDPIRALAEKWSVDKPAKLAEVQGRIDAFAKKMEQTARDRGIPVEQLTSMRQQMIGLEKEKALVEAREGLHFNPDEQMQAYGPRYYNNRKKAGTDINGMGQSPLAQSWENVSDSSLAIDTARGIVGNEGLVPKELDARIANNPWLVKVPPKTKVYSARGTLPERTGFNHLIDELRNATNPESGLPAELLLKYKDLPKITMPQAVELVADINAWRAAQKVEANQALANNAATMLHKEYPGQGMKWVELNQPKLSEILPEGWSTPEAKGNTLQTVSPDGHVVLGNNLPEIIKNIYRRHPDTPGNPYKALEDALQYEGDTMQHCVGGYCPDVFEGKSRIFSLRDNKGQPHVTVEVKPNSYAPKWETVKPYLPAAKEKAMSLPNGYDDQTIADIATEMARKDMPDSIVQIKGKQNRAPAPEYLPFVQDFVKSGKWSNVGDLQNTGLRSTSDAFNETEQAFLKSKGVELKPYIDPEETARYQELFKQGPSSDGMANGGVVRMGLGGRLDFAHGGLVQHTYDPIRIKQIIAGLDDEYDPERIQQIIAQHESEYA